ncbi:hypothetical protein [Sphingobium herbicidovorans]|uniref:hypothetical protein n=1 Tax=Sphingobium herbicidovorans TaxID=76947 RepID=UPI0009DB0B42|nr:hypothetical protein [Sphingobium herbicidovorans]
MSLSMMENSQRQRQAPTRLRDWLGRPWYAKLWWSGVPAYWLGMLASLQIDALAEVYHSAAGGYLNVLFFPPMVAFVLSFGFLRQKMASLADQAKDETDREDCLDRKRYGPSGMPWQFDPLDSRSGTFWIGNPLNPRHPSNINRVS